jgi:cation diffusion facilitator family transporter
MEMDVGEEQPLGVELDSVRNADVANGPAPTKTLFTATDPLSLEDLRILRISDDPSGNLMNVTAKPEADRAAMHFAMNLSLAVGLLMFVMKTGAYLLTGSAAILSDAAESVVHVAAVFFAAYSLRLSYRPPDEDHLYGHAKISFFSAGFEGAMIILAALYIIYESVHKWMTGLRLENLGAGTALTAAAMIINGALGIYLVWLGRRKHSLILEANGKHVLTDCWTSLAVLVGLVLVLSTKWAPFDPICGILMACNILWSGTGLLKSAFTGLMDTADPIAQAKLTEILDQTGANYRDVTRGTLFSRLLESPRPGRRSLRSQAGSKAFVSETGSRAAARRKGLSELARPAPWQVLPKVSCIAFSVPVSTCE